MELFEQGVGKILLNRAQRDVGQYSGPDEGDKNDYHGTP